LPDTSLLIWIIALVLLGLALSALVAGRRVRAGSGLPVGEIVSSDVDESQRGKPMFSERYGLTGTPDYVLQTPGGLIPVEVKPSRRDEEPRDSHLLQVLAYCLLLEDTHGARPTHGLLRYASGTFKVDYNEQTRAYLLGVLDEMRAAAKQDEVDRSHDEPGRCRACAYREICDQSLWEER
jgi:CRISPR-associated exonuclease Cas4